MISDPILTTMTLLYLASLSGCMFFGVLMLESGSPRFDIAVCLFTVVVIFLSHAIILGGDPSVSSDRLHFKDYADLTQWLQVHQVKNARAALAHHRQGGLQDPAAVASVERGSARRRRRWGVHAEHPAESDRHAGAELRRRAAGPAAAELRHVSVDQILTRL